MKRFRPCIGRDHCADDDLGCRTCGRTSCEINEARALIEDMTVVALQLDYENVADFLNYAAAKAAKKVSYRRKQAMEELSHEPA